MKSDALVSSRLSHYDYLILLDSLQNFTSDNSKRVERALNLYQRLRPLFVQALYHIENLDDVVLEVSLNNSDEPTTAPLSVPDCQCHGSDWERSALAGLDTYVRESLLLSTTGVA